jgi:thioredoxin 1
MKNFLVPRFKAASAIAGLLIGISSTCATFAATPQIYSDTADAKAEVRQALQTAAREHKHVLLDFGGNWCGDCLILDLYLHDPGNAALLEANYIVVDVNIGRYDRNLDLAKQYNVPLEKGVPALAILDSNGKLLYSQRNGEFEAMRRMDVSAVTAFLNKWKPVLRNAGKQPPPCSAVAGKTPC